MTRDQATKLVFALDGLIRSRTKGDGGKEYARKCIGEMVEALTTEITAPTRCAECGRGLNGYPSDICRYCDGTAE